MSKNLYLVISLAIFANQLYQAMDFDALDRAEEAVSGQAPSQTTSSFGPEEGRSARLVQGFEASINWLGTKEPIVRDFSLDKPETGLLLAELIGPNWHTVSCERLDLVQTTVQHQMMKKPLTINSLVLYSVSTDKAAATLTCTVLSLEESLNFASNMVQSKYDYSPKLIQTLRNFGRANQINNLILLESAHSRPILLCFMLADQNQCSPIVYSDLIVWPTERSDKIMSSLDLIIAPDLNMLCLRTIHCTYGTFRHHWKSNSNLYIFASDEPIPSAIRAMATGTWLEDNMNNLVRIATHNKQVQMVPEKFEKDNGNRLSLLLSRVKQTLSQV